MKEQKKVAERDLDPLESDLEQSRYLTGVVFGVPPDHHMVGRQELRKSHHGGTPDRMGEKLRIKEAIRAVNPTRRRNRGQDPNQLESNL